MYISRARRGGVHNVFHGFRETVNTYELFKLYHADDNVGINA